MEADRWGGVGAVNMAGISIDSMSAKKNFLEIFN